jgi:uncharacterized short protein YbdD (DUF466 family)
MNKGATMETQAKAVGLLRGAWSWVRQVSGDAAYENYLRCITRHSDIGASAAPAPLLSRAEFYLDSLRRRYSTVSRCC